MSLLAHSALYVHLECYLLSATIEYVSRITSSRVLASSVDNPDIIGWLFPNHKQTSPRCCSRLDTCTVMDVGTFTQYRNNGTKGCR